MVEELIKQILGSLAGAIDRFGSKFLLAAIFIGGVFYMALNGKIEGWIAVASGAVVVLAYFFYRRQQEKETKPIIETSEES